MRDLIQRFFGPTKISSKDDAKSRLKILLVHDQVDLPPAKLELMRAEIIEVIQRYVEVDADGVECRLSKNDEGIALVSSVPVRRVHARA